jgi:2'-5' RNA ligase
VRDPGTLEGRERLRLFCALRLPEPTVERLVAWQARELGGRSGVRMLGQDGLHITLAFLGSRPAGDVEAIAAALRATARGASPPVLTVRRYRETQRVGMLVLHEDEPRHAHRFAGSLMQALEELAVYERERRDWLPHVTVVRFREPPGLHPELPHLDAFSPSEAALYHSVLRPTGAQYEVVESVALGG